MNYTLEDRVATTAEHRLLAESVGWHHAFAWEAMPASLAASVYGVMAMLDGEPVGMGRVVGDGVFYFYIQDIVVLPEHQGRGLGNRILTRLNERIEAEAPKKAFVGLFAANTSTAFYEKHGFGADRGLTGMFGVV